MFDSIWLWFLSLAGSTIPVIDAILLQMWGFILKSIAEFFWYLMNPERVLIWGKYVYGFVFKLLLYFVPDDLDPYLTQLSNALTGTTGVHIFRLVYWFGDQFISMYVVMSLFSAFLVLIPLMLILRFIMSVIYRVYPSGSLE